MSRLIFLLLMLVSAISMASANEWFEVKSEILLKDKALIYGNMNSNAKVIYQQNKINTTFKDLRKETLHHCRILGDRLKGPIQMKKKNSINYCLIDSSHSLVLVSDDGKSRDLHHYQFSNVTEKEKKSFIEWVVINK